LKNKKGEVKDLARCKLDGKALRSPVLNLHQTLPARLN